MFESTADWSAYVPSVFTNSSLDELSTNRASGETSSLFLSRKPAGSYWTSPAKCRMVNPRSGSLLLGTNVFGISAQVFSPFSPWPRTASCTSLFPNSSFTSSSAHFLANVASVALGKAHCSSSSANKPTGRFSIKPTQGALSVNRTSRQSIFSAAYKSCSRVNKCLLNPCCSFSFA